MQRPLTVSELLAAMKSVLGEAFGGIAVEGEIGQLTRHRSGHWYFSLVDAGGTLNAVMFRGNNQSMGWEPEVGDKVVAIGGADVYAPHGKLNFIVRRMEPSGAGARARALEALKQKLAAEGIFDEDRKQAIPFLPRAVGVATSPTGAALHDILNVLGRRFPGVHVLIAPCRVQGEGAGAEVAAAVELLEEHGVAEVIIVGRGGGSAEDLWAFNEEVVVRAVAACAVPVVSAVGHETDVSLCDLAADLRAATPSAGAELVVPELSALLQMLDELEERFVDATVRGVQRRRERLEELRLLHPGERLKRVRTRAADLDERLLRAFAVDLERRRGALGSLAGRLETLSPLAVLGRGYSIVSRERRILGSAEDLVVGETLDVRFSDGSAQVEVLVVQSS